MINKKSCKEQIKKENCEMENDEFENHSHDGIDNDEHLIDMQKEIEIMIENIQDNTDSAFSILKEHENDADQDIVDVYRISCSNILDCEKLVNKKQQEFEMEVSKILNDKKCLEEYLPKIKDIFEQIKDLEKTSSREYEDFITKLNKERI